jgi:hypothetical protein
LERLSTDKNAAGASSHAALLLKNGGPGAEMSANCTQIAPKWSFALRLVALQTIGKSLIYLVSRVFGIAGNALKGLRANPLHHSGMNYKGNAENPPFCSVALQCGLRRT